MDHAINDLRSRLEPELDWLIDEIRSNKFKKLSECPSYPACKALVDAIHVLEKYYYGKNQTLPVKDLVNW